MATSAQVVPFQKGAPSTSKQVGQIPADYSHGSGDRQRNGRPMTHIELLDLDRLPEHLLVIGGGYVGLELAQAMRRFGAAVTVVEFGPQVAGREDADVSAAIRELFRDEGITVHLRTEVRSVRGQSGTGVHLVTSGPDGEGVIEGTDLLIGVGRTPNTAGIGLERAAVKVTETGYIAVASTSPPARPACGRWESARAAGPGVSADSLTSTTAVPTVIGSFVPRMVAPFVAS